MDVVRTGRKKSKRLNLDWSLEVDGGGGFKKGTNRKRLPGQEPKCCGRRKTPFTRAKLRCQKKEGKASKKTGGDLPEKAHGGGGGYKKRLG